jgi:hypothetical protein
MESPRLPRFKRAPVIGPLQLTERDREIIRLIYRYRFLRSPQIVALTGGSSQQLLRRLQLLFHHGYLERPRAQLEYFHRGGSHSMVYGLGDKAGEVLKQEPGTEFRKSRWSELNRSVGRVYLQHALLVSDVIVAIELACRKAGNVRLLTDAEFPVPSNKSSKRPTFRWRATVPSGQILGLIPDRVFALEFQDTHSKSDRIHFFLEADRGTMPVIRHELAQTSMYRKFLAYEATWAQSILITKFGFHRFRVITVTQSAARVQSLVEACAKLERGHGLFLFADRSVLEMPNLLFSKIWQTGRPGEMDSLLN